jgi:hypothetical protein
MGAVLEFNDISFAEDKGKIRVYFLRNFYFDIDASELNEIAKFSIKSANAIEFEAAQAKAERQFQRLLAKHIENSLKSLKGNRAFYIRQPPILGSLRFGLLDRDTNLIEVRPITGCNLNCIYCSIDEGIESEKIDYVADKDLLVSEFRALVKNKKDVEAHIGPQGEPLMYSKLTELIADLSKIPNVKTISMDTNGVMLTKEMVDRLKEAGLTRINLSLNSLDPELAKKIAGCSYNVKRVIETAEYIAKKMDLLIAPVYVPGINDSEIPKLIELAKKLNAKIGIQNFLEYKGGRNPVKQKPWEEFYEMLKTLEKEHNAKLILSAEDFGINEQKTLEKPLRKDDVVRADVIYSEYAAAKGRLIKIKPAGRPKVKVKITRDKHNIYFGSVI